MGIYDHIDYETFTQSWQNWPTSFILFLDTNLPRNFIELALQSARSPEQKICIDPVSVAKSSKLPENLDSVYLLKPNKDEASFLSGIHIQTPEEAILAGNKILKRGVQNVVISLGSEGYVITNRHSSVYIEVSAIENVIDVNGAGDAFLSGILYGLQKELCMEECCAMGHKMACHCLTSYSTAGHAHYLS